MSKYLFTSESVTEGHPDKVCDYIADSILDAHVAQDPSSRVACEVLCKDRHVVLAGEVTSAAEVDVESVARAAIREIGYDETGEPFAASSVKVLNLLGQQSSEIAQGVTAASSAARETGAGDQGIMFGYATDETPELLPLPILLAHRLARRLAEDRKSHRVGWLRPDGKTQVTVRYEDGLPRGVETVLVSTQHRPSATQDAIRDYVGRDLVPSVLGPWHRDGIGIHVNPTGSFVLGGPSADCGVTGRKIIVDTYGGMARHGGGAFSGKDCTKVDRTAAYFCRYVARRIVREGLARRAELQVSYAIGLARPLSVLVETHGTGDADAAQRFVQDNFDFRPEAMIESLGLRQPLYRRTTNYGHFGKTDLPWEKDV